MGFRYTTGAYNECHPSRFVAYTVTPKPAASADDWLSCAIVYVYTPALPTASDTALLAVTATGGKAEAVLESVARQAGAVAVAAVAAPLTHTTAATPSVVTRLVASTIRGLSVVVATVLPCAW